MKRIIFSILLFVLAQTLNGAKDYTQTVRGRLVERETKQPVQYATVGVTSNGNFFGTITDEAGYFRIEKVSVGRATIQFSFVGYENITIQNLELTSGRELIVNAELVERVVSLEGVEIRASSDKEKPLNQFASTSARTFSVEEAQRYPGAANDVSRMAMNFAGVRSADDTQNEIVIRGNSPIGLLFRLEGIDIPNPNHFGDGGTSGGILSMLNVNTLANSDFITGAFPAEYSNTISGVFDLRMRNGNNEKHEFIGQMALMGLEFGAEGPISKKSGYSYLFNYRYSTPGLLDAVVDLDMPSMPTYQDAAFKLNFSSNGGGTTSIIGFGGTSKIDWLESTRDTTESKSEMSDIIHYDVDEYMDNKSGALGIIHTHLLGERAYMRFILSATTAINLYRTDSVSTEDRETHIWSGSKFQRTKYTGRFFINKRLDSRNSFRTGFTIERQNFVLNDSIFMASSENYRTLRDFDGSDYLASPYMQWQHRIDQNIRLNIGVTANYQNSTRNFAAEPRLGFNWEYSEGNTLSFSYGLHSLATPAEVLTNQVLNQYGSYSQPNSDLGFTSSHHFVLGYHKMISETIRVKSEVYYQYITNVPVEVIQSSFSLLNRRSGSDLDFGALTNDGDGFNYGIELTAEKFMDKGSYFLSTLSLFESKYRGSDKVLRNTAFNGNYVFNLLAGKEFKIGSDGRRYIKRLNIDGKFNMSGGQRCSPIDLEASRQIGFTQYDDTNAYSEQMPMYMTINIRTGIKFIGKSATQEIAIGIDNLTNRKNPFFVRYNPGTDNIETVNQFGIIPDILYRIVF